MTPEEGRRRRRSHKSVRTPVSAFPASAFRLQGCLLTRPPLSSWRSGDRRPLSLVAPSAPALYAAGGTFSGIPAASSPARIFAVCGAVRGMSGDRTTALGSRPRNTSAVLRATVAATWGSMW